MAEHRHSGRDWYVAVQGRRRADLQWVLRALGIRWRLVHRRRDVLKHFLMRLEDSARGLGPDEGFRISIPTLNVGFDVIA